LQLTKLSITGTPRNLVVMACFKTLSWYSPGWTEKSHSKIHSEWLAHEPQFKPGAPHVTT